METVYRESLQGKFMESDYIYIYIYRERERERDVDTYVGRGPLSLWRKSL